MAASRDVLLVVILLSAATGSGAAQNEPRRPRLPDGADTNAARSYYQLGLQQLAERPRDARQALYWASRLEPASGDVLYALRVAQLADNEALLWSYMESQRQGEPSRDLIAMDSLLGRALALDPFVYRGPSAVLAQRYIDSKLRTLVRTRPHSMSQTEFYTYVLNLLLQAQPAEAMTISYAERKFQEVVDGLARVIRGHSAPGGLHAERARAFVLLNALDSASNELQVAIGIGPPPAASTALDTRTTWLYSLGRLHERRGNMAGARDAYARALALDSLHWGARMRDGLVLLRTGDTTAALATLQRTVAAAPGEYAPLLVLGETLAAIGRHQEAAPPLRRAIALEPWAATPHRLLGRVLDAAGVHSEAGLAYRRYLGLARRDDPQAAAVRERLAALGPN